MRNHPSFFLGAGLGLAVLAGFSALYGNQVTGPKRGRLNVNPPHISTDPSVKYDYDIVYVRAPRDPSGEKPIYFAEVNNPLWMTPGADLMLLHPDGSEEVLVPGGKGAVMDPAVSFDGEWVYYCYIYDLTNARRHEPPPRGADIYKIHVKTRKVVRLTQQVYTPNTGAAYWLGSPPRNRHEEGTNYLQYHGVFHTGPCPLPGGKVMFTSNRNAFIPPKHSSPCLQLFVMDDDGSNVEQVGFMNLGMALHPVILKDGRVMFSSLESQGLRASTLWGLWSIHPDGTNWGPMLSAFNYGSAAQTTHFQTQLSNGDIVIEEYYQQNNWGFGTYYKFPVKPPPGQPTFGPANPDDPRNGRLRVGRHGDGTPVFKALPFSPYGIESLTPFATPSDFPAGLSDPNDGTSPRVGKFTHPSGAPDNHLLTVWSPGPVNHNGLHLPLVDAGIYLIKDGKPIEEPGQMLLIKNDPNYNEQWPRALVPYKRIYGIDEPPRLPPLANDGKLSPHLPEGTPYGLVGTSSLYKRETYPAGSVPKGGTTAGYSGTGRYGSPLDRGLGLIEDSNSLNWRLQGAEAGLYSNSDIHAIRILAMEPTTLRYPGRRFFNHPLERLRILGEIPVRKFNGDQQPIDPDGNPDTSFLAKIPADIAWTFQTLDKDGMVLNMSQTWHQLRPGEIRNDCGGCHAHSQKPTRFEDTAAARPDYEIFDLTRYTPLLTSKTRDESGKKWDVNDETGLRYESAVKNVEYFRDIKPILERSCVACHTKDPNRAPAGQWLVLDDETSVRGYPAAYYNLVLNANVKPQAVNKRGHYTPSRYIVPMQSRSSLLAWKIYGRRLDGFSNDDFPSPAIPGDPNSLQIAGQPVPPTPENLSRTDTDYTGSVMPPPEAVTGMRLGPDGREIKVEPLTDEDRRTIVRWIDLGCPIDLDYDPAQPQRRGYGWMLDDNRPTLTLTYPRAGANAELSRILIGMDDYYTGLNLSTFEVIADFPVDSVPAGHNLAPRFQEKSQGVWELKLTRPITNLPRGNLLVSIRDRQGNVARIERKFWVSASGK